MKKALVSWSSGKDSAWVLYLLQQSREYEIVGLLTTMNEEFDRVAMHGTRRKLLQLQAKAAGLPLRTVPLPWPCSNEHYECRMQRACDEALAEGVEVIAFGDLFLEEIRAYREKRLEGTGITPIFPVWHLPTRPLMEDMLSAGVKARLVTVDPTKLPPSFAGRDLNRALLEELPPDVDPCGENGEFHTFVYDGPMFSCCLPILSGEMVQRDGFVFADVLPQDAADGASSSLAPSSRSHPPR